MQVPHDIFGKLLQVAMNEAEQSQTHRQHENSLCPLANRHRAQPWLNLHGLVYCGWSSHETDLETVASLWSESRNARQPHDVVVEMTEHGGAAANAGGVHQHASRPAIDVELGQKGSHRVHPAALILC